MFACNICQYPSGSLRAYAHHHRFHRNANNTTFPCAVKGCAESFSTYSTFVRHVSRTHSEARLTFSARRYLNASVELICSVPLCRKRCIDLSEFIKHLKQHLTSGLLVNCPFKKCDKAFKLKSSFSAHLSRKHATWTVAQIDDNHLVSPSLSINDTPEVNVESDVLHNNYEDDTSCGDTEIARNPEWFKVKYFDSTALFYMMLQGKLLVPATTISKIVDELRVTHQLESEYLLSSLQVTLSKYQIPKEQVDDIMKTILQNDIFKECHNANTGLLRSDHMRKTYYSQHFNLVAPVPVLLGCDGRGRPAICHYVPIKETIKSLFMNSCVSFQYDNPLHRDDDVLSDVMDGSVFSSNNFFHTNNHALKIILFQDAFEIVNPLGSARKKHKILGLYFTLADFYPHNRSSVAQMQLVMLCKESDCKYFGDSKVFAQFVNDLIDLEKDGVKVAGDKLIKATIVCISGDNLGSHYIGGFLESFSAEFSCRYCLATRADIAANPFNSLGEQRTVENYNISVNFLKANPNETNFQGVKRDSVFNQLNSFHVTSGLPPCIGHDLFEGIICYDLALCVCYFVKKQWFSYEILNGRIKRFTFIGSDAANKPAEVPISGDRLGGQAVENWTVLRFLGLIIGDKIEDVEDAVWQFVLLMMRLTALICASRLSKAQVAYMKILVEEYLETRWKLFPQIPLRPKHHYLAHYPSLTLKFGPLMRLWTMRFESKHSYFKQCVRSAKNFKNVTGMLAERHQIYQSYQLNGNFFRKEVEISKHSTAFYADLHCTSIQDSVNNFRFSPDDTFVTDSVAIKGNTFSKNCVTVKLGNDQNDAAAVTINCVLLILVRRGVPYFVARAFQGFVAQDVGAFCIRDDCSSHVVCFEASSIAHDYPLHLYNVRGHRFVVLKYDLMDLCH